MNYDAAMMDPVAVLSGVEKAYRLDDVVVPVLKGIDILIRPNHFTVLLGPSGSGKTTLLNIIECVDRPDKGEIIVAGRNVNQLSDDELSYFRLKNIWFIFQTLNLLPVLTTYENIEYPLLLAGVAPAERHRRVTRLLSVVGLADRSRNRPGQLSGGQRQRVAIARALAIKPRLIIADEPTANLDSETGASIIALMRQMQLRHQITFIFSSHDRSLINAADDLIVCNRLVPHLSQRHPVGIQGKPVATDRLSHRQLVFTSPTYDMHHGDDAPPTPIKPVLNLPSFREGPRRIASARHWWESNGPSSSPRCAGRTRR